MLGYDLSHWNSDTQFNECLNNADFIILKATEGKTWVDHTFEIRMQKVIANDILAGAYHLWNAKKSAEDHANNFIKAVKPFVKKSCDCNCCEHGEKRNIILALDVENCVADYDAITNFLDIVENETGIRPLIYHNLADYKKYKCNERAEKYWIAAWSWNVGSIIKDNIVMHQYKGNPIDEDYIERKGDIL